MNYELLLASAIENYRIFYSRYTKAKIDMLNSQHIDDNGNCFSTADYSKELEKAEYELKKARDKLEEIKMLKEIYDDKNKG